VCFQVAAAFSLLSEWSTVMVASTSMCSQPSWAGAAPAAHARSRACARAARIRRSRVASMRSSTSRHSVLVEATGPNAC
jgi:hypothetical protein